MVPKFFFSCLLFVFLSLASTKPAGECPQVDIGRGDYLADDDNCAGYYACTAGVPIHMFCAQGTYWDPATRYCEVGPETAHCDSRPTTPGPSQ